MRLKECYDSISFFIVFNVKKGGGFNAHSVC